MKPYIFKEDPVNDDLNIVGKRVVRSDSLAKVTGEARYTGDLKLPNMLVAKVLRSP
jgi:CO/xanthine dehydrogenase Mo-binding subunit